MSRNIWFVSDHHLAHKNMLKFPGPRREMFSTIEEHDEYII